MRVFLSRVLDLLWRRRRDERLDAEVESHLAFLREEYLAQGMSEEAARLAARRSFGGVDQIIALVSSAGPVRRSLRIDPLAALREE